MRGMPTLPRIVPLMILICVLLAPAVGGADTEADKHKARSLFLKANRFLDRGMFLEALAHYRKARKLYPSYKIDLNIGGCLDAMGRHGEAATYLEKFLIESEKAPPKVIAQARKRLDELKKKLARLNLSCAVEGATVVLDDKIVGQTPLEIPIYMKPGKHLLKVIKAEHRTYTRRLTVKAQQVYKLAVVLGMMGDTVKAQAKPIDPPAAPRPAPTLEAALGDAKEYRRKSTWAYTALGVGVALTATAMVLYGVGGSQGSEAHEAYQAATDQDVIEDRWTDVQAAESKLIAANVVMGVAVAALGFSVYHFLTRPGEAPASPGGPAGASISLTRDQGALLTFGGSF